MKFNRIAASLMSILDPDNPSADDPIKYLLVIDEKLLVFKKNGIYEIISADSIDPERNHQNTRPTYLKLFSIGTEASIVARLVIQFDPMLELVKALPKSNISFDELKKQIWEANKLLLECENAYFGIYKDVMELLPKCDEVVEKSKTANYIPALPQVQDLEGKASRFFSCAKKFLITTFGIFELFFDMPHFGSKFDKSVGWLSVKLGDESTLVKMLNDDLSWIKIISECRNALEHPKNNYCVSFKNFHMKAGNLFSLPTWSYDLTFSQGMSKLDSDFDLIKDFQVHLENLLTFHEQVVLLCLESLQGFEDMFVIYHIKESEIDNECPVFYKISISEKKLNTMGEG